MDTAAAPKEDKEENSKTKNNDNVLKDPISYRDVLVRFLGTNYSAKQRDDNEGHLQKFHRTLLICWLSHASFENTNL